MDRARIMVLTGGAPVDITAPTCTITTSAEQPLTEAFTATVTFSEAVTGFEAGDLTVTNGAASDFADSGDHKTYTATITPDWVGTVSVAVAAGVCQDPSGNANEASNTLTLTIPTYDNVSEDFSSDPGWIDGDLAVAAMDVTGGTAIWTPSYGAEKNVGPNAVSDPNGNEADATTGFTATNATLTSESSDVSVGSYALQVSGTGTSARGIFKPIIAANKWLLWNTAAKSLGGTGLELRMNNALLSTRITPTTSWVQSVIACITATSGWEAWYYPSANGQTLLADNVSIKEIDLSSAVRLKRLNYPSALTVKTYQNSIQYPGLALGFWLDEGNHFFAFQGYSSIRRMFFISCIAGVYSEISANVSYSTYGAGRVLSITPNATFDHFTVAHHGTTLFDNIAFSTFANTAGPWYAMLLSPYNPGDHSKTAFDDFTASRVASSSPFR